jgi:hypothetical protein
LEPREVNITGRKRTRVVKPRAVLTNHYYLMKKKSAFESVRRNFHQSGFFRLRVLSGVLLCFAGVTLVLALGKASAQPRTPAVQTKMLLGGLAAANKVAPWVMEHTTNGQEAEFFVVLADQADLSPAASLATKAEKGDSYTKLCRTRPKQHKVRFRNGCANAALNINRFILLMRFW